MGGSLKLLFKYKSAKRLESWLNFIHFFQATEAIDLKQSAMNSQIDHERKPTQSVIEIGRGSTKKPFKIYFSSDYFRATIRPFAYFVWPLSVACKVGTEAIFSIIELIHSKNIWIFVSDYAHI